MEKTEYDMKEITHFKKLKADIDADIEARNAKIEAIQAKHKEAIANLLIWCEERVIGSKLADLHNLKVNTTLGCLFKVDGVDAFCVEQNIVGFPFFSAQIVLKPVSITDDIGNGCGNVLIMNFMNP